MVKKICVTDNSSAWICDDTEELKTMKNVHFGDTCFVIHTSTKYVLDSHYWWYSINGTSDPVACDCVSELTIWGELPEN